MMLPRLKFAVLPTPIEPMPRLSAALGGPSLWIKRDDLTGLGLGGNKTRKLEYLLAEAQANGARMVITAGAGQSNHCRQTAAAAARFGFDCTLVLTGEPQEHATGNLLLDRLFGAQIVWTEKDQRDAVLKQTFQAAWDAGKRPYLIPYGGSNPVGAAAYAEAIHEMIVQQMIPDWIVFASSSGGTQAGMVVGVKHEGLITRILGISVDEPADVLKDRVASLANETADRLNYRMRFSPEEIMVNDQYTGAGYGVLSDREREAVQLFARNEGILLDPVYTGRAAGGMIDLIRKDFFKTGEKVLFWHTGGTPALFANLYQDII